jgi:hypothetical protein
MKGFIWNSDGFRDPAKHSLIKETVKNINLISLLSQKPVEKVSRRHS